MQISVEDKQSFFEENYYDQAYPPTNAAPDPLQPPKPPTQRPKSPYN